MILNKTLHALKKRLDEKGNMEIVAEQGNIHTVHCSFNPPIESGDLKAFQEERKWMFPEDFQQFLSQHNGAKMYEMLLGSINIGGGLQIYSIEEIKEINDALKSLYDYIPIGYVLENNLLISRTAIERDDPDYLYIAGTSLKPEPLHSNLEIFLDRFVVSQGSNFWEWPNYTAKNYYKHSGGIEF
ncbi:SMI1/KNR4 family protein [Rossellomorea sp. GCM10028870]|uniref:SMI1/KNR4 family protein n=1 Tax=Rossellomorea sp. GCM10028870 TaxID=3273426 RepID=UPI00361E54B4